MKTIIFLFAVISSMFISVSAHAQAMLQGASSWENFIGSPGMWVMGIGVFLYIVFVLITHKKTKNANS